MHSAASLVIKPFAYQEIQQEKMKGQLLKVLAQDDLSLNSVQTKKKLIEIYNNSLTSALNKEPKRKVLTIQESVTEKLRIGILSVLDSQSHDEVADIIVSVALKHYTYIKQLKDDGYKVIGYCRKPKKASDNRALLLQRIINIPYQRSLVQKVFVSPVNSAKQALSERDLFDQDILSGLDQIHGNTQGEKKKEQNNNIDSSQILEN